MHGALNRLRLLAACALLAAAPISVILTPLARLTGVVVILVALIVVETMHIRRAGMCKDTRVLGLVLPIHD